MSDRLKNSIVFGVGTLVFILFLTLGLGTLLGWLFYQVGPLFGMVIIATSISIIVAISAYYNYEELPPLDGS